MAAAAAAAAAAPIKAQPATPCCRDTPRITRAKLSAWFDHALAPVSSFRWDSALGAQAFAQLRRKRILVTRHCESTYQVACNDPRYCEFPGRRRLWCNIRFRDSPLTERGKLQAAALGALLHSGGPPQLLVSSPLTRCLQTGALMYPQLFLADTQPPTTTIKVLSKLLPELVHSWGDTGRSLDEVCDEHP